MDSLTDDELDYLSPGFDPASLTVPKLRAILVEHDIQYPASSKKPQLIDIFNEQLKPRAKKLLSARDRIRRTSKGITDVPSSQEGSVLGDGDDRAAMPPPPRPKTPGRSRKSTKSEDPETPAPVKRTPSRKSSSKKLRTDSEEDRPRSTVRRSRKSEVTATVKSEETEPPRRADRDESVFSSDNPFQSGSSPLDEDSRRKSGHKPRKSSSSSKRRSTEGQVKEDGLTRSVEVPVSRLRTSNIKKEETIEPGEEFTAQEQQELADGIAKGEVDINRPKNKRKRRSAVPKSAPWIVMTTLLSGIAAWYRKEKIDVGYCGIGKQVGALEEIEVPEWAMVLQPQCEPCPPHALCFAGMEVQCETDFVLQEHPLSLLGLIPLPPTCEPDSEKERKVQAVANRAVEELRERRAKWECGDLSEEDGTPATAVEIEESKLKEEVSKKRRRGMSAQEFDELWNGAVGEMKSREEVESEADGSTGVLRLSSSSLARLPLGCAIRRSIRQTLARYRLQAGAILTLISILSYAWRRFKALRGDKARVPALVSSTLDRLATQAALHAQGSATEPFISMGQMRDDVLRDEFSIKRRDEIWNRVKLVVEMNTNVRPSVREGRHGEVSRVWEWIGNLPVLDDGWNGDRRQSGRYSLGSRRDTPERKGSPLPMPERQETPEHRKWDEGRPIY